MSASETAANLDRLCADLETQLAKLNTALKHWQTWEAEYAGLEEGLQHLPDDVTEMHLLRVGEEYEGDLVTAKEIKELLRSPSGASRSPKQILGLLDRRQDYVQKNVETLQKQIGAIRVKLESVQSVSDTAIRNEEGLPITDIYEELDEDGNVISGRISQPKDAEARVLEALGKAGVNQQDLVDGSSAQKQAPQEPEHTKPVPRDLVTGPTAPSKQSEDDLMASRTSSTTAPTETSPTEIPEKAVKQPSAHLQDVAMYSFPNGERVLEVNSDDEEISSVGPGQPIKESATDAAMRARMLEYNMREVGDIVAQLDLDEGGASDVDTDDEDLLIGDEEDEDEDLNLNDEDDDAYDASSVEDEDVHGLSRKGNMSEAYKQEMMALEKRLNARMFQNVGPSPDLTAPDAPIEDTAATEPLSQPSASKSVTLPIRTPETETVPRPKPEAKTKPSKGVRFADSLDVAPAPEKPIQSSNSATTSTAPPAMKDTIIERQSTAPPSSDTQPIKKISRFKAARQAQAQASQSEVTPHRSATRPLADTIIERPRQYRSAVTPEESEFDPRVQCEQIEREYYRRENAQIQRRGGYERTKYDEQENDDDEAEVSEDDEDLAGNGKRMSLFKRARVSGWQGARGGV